ncbi:MAG: alpha/beta fold hydrolase [Chloroflexi bacterium]|nr:alpha/beta fold hydrolase [Chloroflexota bacterium]
MSFHERALELASGGLQLEAMLHEGDGALAALVLHPHPQYGGDMDNHVVLAACHALADDGATTLRFNFRGAGRSQGAYDGGRGEAEDARAAVAALRALKPDAPVLLAGYSFGAMVAAGIAADAAPAGLVLVSPPLGMGALPPNPGVPLMVITGDRDPVCRAEAALALASDAVRVVVVPGADHGWWPGVDALQAELLAFERALPL